MEKQLSKQDKRNIERHVEKHFRRVGNNVMTKAEFLGAQFKQHVSTAIIAAFSFLIALTWKDLIVHAVGTIVTEEFLKETPYFKDVISAIVVTVIAIAGIYLVTRWAKKPHVLESEATTS